MQVEVGQIVNTHGIKGEVKVKSNSDFTDTRFQPGEVLTVNHQNHEEQLTVLSYRVHKGFHMLKFEGMNNINDVEQYKGDYLYQERDHEDIELAENEYYYSDIIGSTVFDNDNQPIGRVINILKQVQMMFGLLKEKRISHSYIADVVKEIDIENKTIRITPMEGLLD